ncbi:MAG: polysaccharide deacetylase family protein [Calditrichaeota bacterium]|nr:MAG: polysaccharide deacetylase family protein [Calditrichota bacterium]
MLAPVLAYHRVSPGLDLGASAVSPAAFEKQMTTLARLGYRTISLASLFASHQSTRGPAVVLTFDDADRSVYEYAFPILREYGFTATLFVITRFVGRANSWDHNLLGNKSTHCTWSEIREMAEAGWEVGSHTVTHRALPSLTPAQLWFELAYSRVVLENTLGRPVTVLSYPFGKYDRRVIAAAKRAGYRAACTLGYPSDAGDFCFTIPRKGVYAGEPPALFLAKLSGGPLAKADAFKQRVMSFCARGTSVFNSLRQFQKRLD